MRVNRVKLFINGKIKQCLDYYNIIKSSVTNQKYGIINQTTAKHVTVSNENGPYCISIKNVVNEEYVSAQINHEFVDIPIVKYGYHTHNYFEAYVDVCNFKDNVFIGIAQTNFAKDAIVGRKPSTYAFNAEMGMFIANDDRVLNTVGYTCGDTVGCGINGNAELYFTKNGKYVGSCGVVTDGKYYPTISFKGEGSKIKINLTGPFNFPFNEVVQNKYALDYVVKNKRVQDIILNYPDVIKVFIKYLMSKNSENAIFILSIMLSILRDADENILAMFRNQNCKEPLERLISFAPNASIKTIAREILDIFAGMSIQKTAVHFDDDTQSETNESVTSANSEEEKTNEIVQRLITLVETKPTAASNSTLQSKPTPIEEFNTVMANFASPIDKGVRLYISKKNNEEAFEIFLHERRLKQIDKYDKSCLYAIIAEEFNCETKSISKVTKIVNGKEITLTKNENVARLNDEEYLVVYLNESDTI